MSHTYEHKGFKYPSVTTIISDCSDKSGALTQWAANMTVEWIRQNCNSEYGGIYEVSEDSLENARFNFRAVSQDALDIGSAVHHAIEHWLKTREEPTFKDLPENTQDQALAAFVAFLEFYDEHEMESYATEETVYGNCWAGTLDWRGLFNGKRYVIDFKTSKGMYPAEMGPQIAAYRSTFDLKMEGCGILRLDKETGMPEWKDFSKRYEQDLRVFNAMVNLYFERHPIIRKKAGWQLAA